MARSSSSKTRPAAPPKKKAAVERLQTISLKRLAAEIAASYDDVPVAHAEVLFGDLVNVTTEYLLKGHKVKLTGLGQLVLRDLPARQVRNPRTGESIETGPSRKVAFRVAKELKTQLGETVEAGED